MSNVVCLETMNTYEIGKLLFNDSVSKNIFCGVFAADQVPVLNKKYAAYVVNTDKTGLPGRHWVALFVDNYKLEYFDSYGQPPLTKFNYFLKDRRYTYNNEQLQSVISTACGQYVIYYILQRCKRVSMQDIVNDFSDNYLENDIIVTDVINTRYNLTIPLVNMSVCFPGQVCTPFHLTDFVL